MNLFFVLCLVCVQIALSFNLNMVADGRRPLMGGNWKLNPKTTLEATNLATEIAKLTKGVTDVDICIFPPHPFLVPVYTKIEATNVQLGTNLIFHSIIFIFLFLFNNILYNNQGVKIVILNLKEPILEPYQHACYEMLVPNMCYVDTVKEDLYLKMMMVQSIEKLRKC